MSASEFILFAWLFTLYILHFVDGLTGTFAQQNTYSLVQLHFIILKFKSVAYVQLWRYFTVQPIWLLKLNRPY